MKRFESQKQIKGKIYSRTTLIVLLVLIILLAKGVFNIYLRNKESVMARDETKQRVEGLNERKLLLSSEIDKLNQEEGVEQEIREKFNVRKPGENVVLIIPADEATTTAPKQGFWASLWHKVW